MSDDTCPKCDGKLFYRDGLSRTTGQPCRVAYYCHGGKLHTYDECLRRQLAQAKTALVQARRAALDEVRRYFEDAYTNAWTKTTLLDDLQDLAEQDDE